MKLEFEIKKKQLISYFKQYEHFLFRSVVVINLGSHNNENECTESETYKT